MAEALAILLGLAFLRIFYRAVQLQWPESYFGASDLSVYSISTSPIRYLLFRFAPVFVAALFVSVSLNRSGHSGLIGAVGVGGGHAVLTSGWALIQATRWPAAVRRHRFPILLLRAAVLLLLFGLSYLAYLSSDVFSPLVPHVGSLP